MYCVYSSVFIRTCVFLSLHSCTCIPQPSFVHVYIFLSLHSYMYTYFSVFICTCVFLAHSFHNTNFHELFIDILLLCFHFLLVMISQINCHNWAKSRKYEISTSVNFPLYIACTKYYVTFLYEWPHTYMYSML